MGRYYDGDIEGKFWFGVQSSSDADFFGVSGYQPEHLEYEFEKENLPDVKTGIATCRKELGAYEKTIKDFFKKVDGYNDKVVEEHELDPTVFNEKLEWYARLELGKKIAKSIKENGHCYFNAEC